MAIKTNYSESRGKQQVSIILSNIKNLLVEIIESYPDSEKFVTQRFYDADGFKKSLKEFPYFTISPILIAIDYQKANGLGSNRPVSREIRVEYIDLMETEGALSQLDVFLFMEYLYIRLSTNRHEIYNSLPSGELPHFSELNIDTDVKLVDGKEKFVRKSWFVIRTYNHNIDGSVGRNSRA